MKATLSLALAAIALLAQVSPAAAWGDEGHKTIALIAQHYLTPKARSEVSRLLAADQDTLTPHDIASAATWADRYRDSDRNTTKVRYDGTHLWHFVDIELQGGNFDQACFNHPALPAGTPASAGPARTCVADKIAQFWAELANPNTAQSERIIALKFLLHFMGDLHQPLHASDDHDAGGNAKNVTSAGFHAGKLHHFWDTEFVIADSADPATIAASLIQSTPDSAIPAIRAGTPKDWALEAHRIAASDAYGQLPPPGGKNGNSYALSAAYVAKAKVDVKTQLVRAGIRLANVLNTSFQ